MGGSIDPLTADPGQHGPDRVSALLDAACRVIARDGAHGLHMKAVADEAGVSKALVHYYFATRQELLRRAFGHAEARLNAALDGELDALESGRDRLRRALALNTESYASASGQHGLWNEVWSSVTFDPALRPLMRDWYGTWLGRLQGLIEEAAEDGSVAAVADARESAWRLAALSDGIESMLYLEMIDVAEASAMLDAALARELG